MTKGTVYLKAEQHVEVTNPKVKLSDVMKVYSVDASLEKKVSALILLQSREKKDKDYMFSILKVVELVSKEFPEVDIKNEGEKDFIITIRYSKTSPVWLEYGKVAGVSLLCFFGAAFSIMTFNEDVSVQDVFGYLCERITGNKEVGRDTIQLSYCIGLPLGIILFYNHFAGFRVQRDPTPIQTQMRLYEEDVNRTLLRNADREGKMRDVD